MALRDGKERQIREKFMAVCMRDYYEAEEVNSRNFWQEEVNTFGIRDYGNPAIMRPSTPVTNWEKVFAKGDIVAVYPTTDVITMKTMFQIRFAPPPIRSIKTITLSPRNFDNWFCKNEPNEIVKWRARNRK